MNIIIIIAAVVLYLLGICFLIRNGLVFRFKIWLNQRCYEIVNNYLSSCESTLTEDEMKNYTYLKSIWDSIMNISYAKMLFSFKPLKPEYWLTKEQQDFLNL